MSADLTTEYLGLRLKHPVVHPQQHIHRDAQHAALRHLIPV